MPPQLRVGEDSMRSIYDLMRPSNQRDAVTTEVYPDILTAPLHKFRYEAPPEDYQLTMQDIKRPDRLVYEKYNMNEFDDILFFINGIGFIKEMEPGTEIKIPKRENIERFFNRGFSQ